VRVPTNEVTAIATPSGGEITAHLGGRDRTMTIDTRGTPITEFGIGPVERRELIARGEETAREFLRTRAPGLRES
jgi:NTE family protein